MSGWVTIGLSKQNLWDYWCKIYYRPDALLVTQLAVPCLAILRTRHTNFSCSHSW